MSIRKRWTCATMAVLVMVGVLSGCSILKPGMSTVAPTPTDAAAGISSDAAVVLLNAVPGLSDATVRSSISGLSTATIIEVYVDDEAAMTAEGVLDYVLRVGWATSFDRQPAELTLTVRSNGQTLDLQTQANLLAGFAYPPTAGVYSVYFNGPEYLGAWPGAVPTLSAG
ncbi:hypothetical protein [Cryobacterium luteum]|uniref:Uncharacterized protein n=1 Tax=Cryobacterium luteum TaxID=1424661 RepID=A0A1H8BPB6_9MICO|nr:hypothetical protein [Cryobacterium luteum]TFB89081.1 hypothetical protein E3O10_09250 [Cryobacterium luteum]SEM84379.1 hypothetical protein SAMN05216281_10244 [Cryobacterium luteum]